MGTLIESAPWHRPLLDTVPDVVFRYRLAEPRGFDYVNPAVTAVTGYTPDEHYADPDLGKKLILDEDRAALERILASGADGTFLLRWRRKDGQVIWVEQRLTTERDGSGQPVAVHGVGRDVTAERLSERLIHTLRSALDQAPVSVMLTDPSGAIEYVNPTFTRTTGYGADEVIGRNPRFLKSGEVPAETYRELWGTITSGGVWQGQLINRRKDGSLFQEEAAIFPVLDESGKTVSFCGVKEDVTERERMRAEHAQSQKMEAVGRMAAGIAHDFNNVLAVVLCLSRELYDEMSPHDPRRGDLSDVLAAAERGGALARQLLEFSRHQPRKAARVDLCEAARQSSRLLSRTMTARRSLIFAGASDPVWVLADGSEIEQVLLNLVINARDAIAEGGHVAVSVERDERQRRAVLVVRDDGPGMTEEVRQRVFEPFFTTKPGGNGLGLSTVFAIAKRLGGGVEVVSQPGEGCEIRVGLPLA